MVDCFKNLESVITLEILFDIDVCSFDTSVMFSPLIIAWNQYERLYERHEIFSICRCIICTLNNLFSLFCL